MRRVRHALGIYDLLRIDHFRGFDTYWAIPADSTTARTGKWENGPGMELFDALEAALGKLPIIAEDLGELFPSVRLQRWGQRVSAPQPRQEQRGVSRHPR